MIATPERNIAPSVQKYGTIILEDGFTQYPRAVEDYLNTISICSTAIRLIFILMSYRWTAEQEIFPSVRKLAERCKVSPRRINQITAQLAELGLIIKSERFSERSQIENYYDLEPLFEKVAAWKSTELAAKLAEQESQADQPFKPVNELEEWAQAISLEYSEPTPRQQRYNAQRLWRRYEQHQPLAWPNFVSTIEKAAKQTEERRAEPTRTGHAFEKLVPYFFSALDYRLSLAQKIDAPAIPPNSQPTTQPQTTKNKEQQPGRQDKGPQQPEKKIGLLAERARARKAAESAGQHKVHAPETLQMRIEAVALTFRDKQVKSSIQRAANLMEDACLDELTMCELVADARAKASKATNVKNRMPYFFSILEEKIQKMLQ